MPPKNFLGSQTPLQGKHVPDPVMMTFEDTFPDGIVVGPTNYGTGLYCMKQFTKGDLMWSTQALLIEDGPGTIRMKSNNGDFALTCVVHSTQRPIDKKRWLYGFHSFMNHSCEPNTESWSRTISLLDKKCVYDVIAARDIEYGEELTSDYNCFEWDCVDKLIDNCGCGAETCKRVIHGFSFLAPADQAKIIASCEPEMASWWYQGSANMSLPSSLQVIQFEKERLALVTTKNISAGEIIFKIVEVPFLNAGDVSTGIVIDTAHCKGVGYAGFLTGSVSANVSLRLNEGCFEVVAQMGIPAGHVLTCIHSVARFMQDFTKPVCADPLPSRTNKVFGFWEIF